MTNIDKEKEPTSGEPSAEEESVEEFKELFLIRMERLVHLREDRSQLTAEDDKLLGWATYSTFSDLLKLGLGDEARGLLGLDKKSGDHAPSTAD